MFKSGCNLNIWKSERRQFRKVREPQQNMKGGNPGELAMVWNGTIEKILVQTEQSTNSAKDKMKIKTIANRKKKEQNSGRNLKWKKLQYYRV